MRYRPFHLRIPHSDDRRRRTARFCGRSVILQRVSRAASALLLLASALSIGVGRVRAQKIPPSSTVTLNSTSLNGPGNVFLTANLVRTGGVGSFGASASVAAADFNGDGKPDLAVADDGADAVSVLLGKGDGTFLAPIDTTGMRGQSYVAAGDFNGDGKADLAAIGTVSAVPTVAVLLGNGDGTFTSSSTFSSFSNPQSVVLVDLDGDGKLDLAVVNAVNNNDSVVTLLGNGDGTFQAPVTTSSLGTTLAKYAAPGDFNKDGKLDLVISDQNGNHVVVLLGNANGTFQAARVFVFPSAPVGWDVAVGDFNADSVPDIAATSRDAGVANIFLGNGDGNFQAAVSFNASMPNFGPTNLGLADFNKDSKLDIITSLGNSSAVGVLFGKGDGTFSAPLFLAANNTPAQLAVADFNGDGNLDWVAGSTSQMFLTVVLGNGNGTFQDAVNYTLGVLPLVTLGDFNADGILDLVTLNPNSGNISVLPGKGDGTFLPAINTPVPLAGFGIAVGDFDNDGNPDVVVSDSGGVPATVSVLLGMGDGTFAAPVRYPAGGSSAGQVAVADFSGDAKLDIAVVNQSQNTISVLLGNGDGTFQAGQVATPALATDGFSGFLVAADLNRDGKMDLAVPDFCGLNCGQLAILLGNGDGTFQAPAFLTTGAGATGLAVAELNKDAKLDLVVANQLGTVDVFLGNGDGTFNTPVVLNTTTCPSSAGCPGAGFQPHPGVVAVADFDLDGNPDLAVGGLIQDQGSPGNFFSNVNLGFELFLGHGDGTFTGPQDYLAGVMSNTMAAGDFNRDGAPDLAAGNSTENFITVLLNQTPPPVNVSPKSLTFGDQLVGTSSATQPITVTNNAAAATTISVAASGDFTQTDTCPVSPATLASGSNCTINVAFRPSTTGLRNGTLAITYNFPGSPQTVALTGTGVAPAVTLGATSINFGNQIVGTSSATQVVGLTNTGTATLTISSITITGANSGDFSQTNTCGTSVAAGANCSISVMFKPTATGNRAASATITDDAADSPQSVSLTGTGVAPAVTLAPTTLTFPGQLVSTTSAAQNVTLTNSGTAPLTISSIAVTGANSGDFAQTNTCPASPATLAAGANCTISATFKPTATGNRAASVTITDDAAGSPQGVSLSGTGTDFRIEAATGANCPAGGNCSTSATITAGQAASYNLQVAPVSGFNGTVALSCAGAPSRSTCTVSPGSVTPSGVSASSFTVTDATTAPSMIAPRIEPPKWPPFGVVRFGLPLLLALILSLLLARSRAAAEPRRGLASAPALGALLLILACVGGCAGGGGGGGGQPNPGTPKGTYTLTITGTSGGVSHTQNLTLTVN